MIISRACTDHKCGVCHNDIKRGDMRAYEQIGNRASSTCLLCVLKTMMACSMDTSGVTNVYDMAVFNACDALTTIVKVKKMKDVSGTLITVVAQANKDFELHAGKLTYAATNLS